MLAGQCRAEFTSKDVEVIVHDTSGHFTALLVFRKIIAVEGGDDVSIVRALENLLMSTAALMETVSFEVNVEEHVELHIEGVKGGRFNSGLFCEESVQEVKDLEWIQ